MGEIEENEKQLTDEQMLRLRRRLRERVFNLPNEDIFVLAKKYGLPLVERKKEVAVKK